MSRPIVSISAERLYATLFPQTKEDEDNDWHLLLFCEALAGTAFEKVRSYVSDRDDGLPGWTIVFDADLCPAEALPYLAQFVGVTWEPELTEEQQRAAIKAREGFARGTPAAIKSLIERWLTGSKSIILDERWENNAYRIRVRTHAAETADPEGLEADLKRNQKPIGIVLVYEAIFGQQYRDVNKKFKNYKEVKEAYPNYITMKLTFP